MDWSGAASDADAASAVFTAVAEDGRLVALEGGRGREATVDAVIDLVLEEPETLVGLDFAFGVPAWLAAREGWRSAGEVWRWAARGTASGPGWVRARPEPFWGPGIRPRPTLAGDAFRATERAAMAAGARPSSVLRLSGPGSVGAQTLWGMPQLLRLADAGVAIWPFDVPRLPMAVEVFPRQFARWLAPRAAGLRGAAFREAAVAELGPAVAGHAGTMTASQDAFDAAVAALGVWHAVREAGAPAPGQHPDERVEGRILMPPDATTPAPSRRPGRGTGR
ncbi:MAG: DUF429 domain-containing protein [Thermoleophilia bacterium]|nr:DUF429 domain-containing protein [Thermoleophilia bacterium]